MLSHPADHATGTDATSAARVTSAVTSTVRRGSRSTQTPAGRPISRNAAVLSAPSSPTCPGLAASRETASTGTASWPTWNPMPSTSAAV